MQSKENVNPNNNRDELEEAMHFNILFEGLADGAGFTPTEARRAIVLIFIHNTADFIINNIMKYFFAADQLRGNQLLKHLLEEIDLLKKANTLKKCNVIGSRLFKSLAKLNNIRVAIAHGKEKDDRRLEYEGKNILLSTTYLIGKLDEETVGELLKINEKIRRIRINKDKWPEKPFIQELYDKDRQ